MVAMFLTFACFGWAAFNFKRGMVALFLLSMWIGLANYEPAEECLGQLRFEGSKVVCVVHGYARKSVLD